MPGFILPTMPSAPDHRNELDYAMQQVIEKLVELVTAKLLTRLAVGLARSR